jgi:CheY-like chemotaxis protein
VTTLTDGTALARILIVEDERVIARDLAKTLVDLGYAVVDMVATGEDAKRGDDLSRAPLSVSAAGFYAWRKHPPSARATDNTSLEAEVRSVFDESHGRYGAPRVHAELVAHGRKVSLERGFCLTAGQQPDVARFDGVCSAHVACARGGRRSRHP